MNESPKSFLSSLNIVSQCRKYRVSIWLCPPFLFVMMGVFIIVGMVVTWIIALRASDDPSVVVLTVTSMTVLLFIVGHAVITSFERIADASRMKSEFVSIVSHQLRSPLSAIKWQLEIMLEQMKTITGGAEGTMRTIKDQNERMIELVNDLLEVNRIEDDRLILRPTLIQFDLFLDTLLKGYQPLVAQAKKNLIFEAKDKGLWVFADESKLRWITENLLENAIRYTKEGGNITVRVVKDGSSVRTEVEDNGIGIPVVDQAKIFTQFFRAENALRLRSEGTGLGLYLVRSLVRAMAGKVGFASLEGKGSTFWFTFPLKNKEVSEANNTK
jgi:signal transduction histidine kinase